MSREKEGRVFAENGGKWLLLIRDLFTRHSSSIAVEEQSVRASWKIVKAIARAAEVVAAAGNAIRCAV